MINFLLFFRSAKKMIGLTIILGIFLCFLGQIVVDVWSYSRPSHSERQVARAKGLQYLWEQDLYSVPLEIQRVGISKKNIFMPLTNEQVIIPVYRNRFLFYQHEYLLGFDLSTGVEKWQIKLDNEEDFKSEAFANTDQQIFVFMTKVAGNNSRISAVNMSTGNVMWTRNLANLNSASDFYATKNILNYRGHGRRSTNYSEIGFDVFTGNRVQYVHMEPSEPNRSDYTSFANELGYENIARVAVYENLLLMLIVDDSSLWILDKETREILGNVYFDSTPLIFDGKMRFEIGYSNGIVVVYFGDSQQLMAFELIPPNE